MENSGAGGCCMWLITEDGKEYELRGDIDTPITIKPEKRKELTMNEKIYECPICSIYGVDTSIYKDARGWRYKVMKNKNGLFQPHYRKPGENEWRQCRNFKARVVDGSAQIELDEWAVKKGKEEGQDGTKRYVTKIIAQEMEFLDSRNETGQQQGNTPGGFGGSTVEDEEIPF